MLPDGAGDWRLLSANMLDAANQGSVSTNATQAQVPLTALRQIAVPLDSTEAEHIVRNAGYVC